jgi:hypothetical protein
MMETEVVCEMLDFYSVWLSHKKTFIDNEIHCEASCRAFPFFVSSVTENFPIDHYC